MSKLVIRQYKSAIGEKESARQTLESLGSTNPVNVVMATMSALKSLRSAETVGETRGVELGKKRADKSEELVSA